MSVEYSSDDEGMIYTRLGLSHWESDTPYFSTPEEITRLVNGHMNDHWCVILSDSLKAAINSNEMKSLRLNYEFIVLVFCLVN